MDVRHIRLRFESGADRGAIQGDSMNDLLPRLAEACFLLPSKAAFYG